LCSISELDVGSCWLLFKRFKLEIELCFLLDKLVPPNIGLQDGFERGRVVSYDFLFDIPGKLVL